MFLFGKEMKDCLIILWLHIPNLRQVEKKKCSQSWSNSDHRNQNENANLTECFPKHLQPFIRGVCPQSLAPNNLFEMGFYWLGWPCQKETEKILPFLPFSQSVNTSAVVPYCTSFVVWKRRYCTAIRMMSHSKQRGVGKEEEMGLFSKFISQKCFENFGKPWDAASGFVERLNATFFYQ